MWFVQLLLLLSLLFHAHVCCCLLNHIVTVNENWFQLTYLVKERLLFL